MTELSLEQLNPSRLLSGLIFDPRPMRQMGMLLPQLFNLGGFDADVVTDPNQVSGPPMSSAIDISPFRLIKGQIRVREPHQGTSADYGQAVFNAVDAGAATVEQWPYRDRSYDCNKEIYESAVVTSLASMSAADPDFEMQQFRAARMGHNIKLERYLVDKLSVIAADTVIDPARDVAGWTERDWNGLGYTALATTTAFVEDFLTELEAFRLRNFGVPANCVVMNQNTYTRLKKIPGLKGFVGDASAGIAQSRDGEKILTDTGLRAVFMSLFGLRIRVQSYAVNPVNQAGTPALAYLYPDSRMWIGVEGPVVINPGTDGSPNILEPGGSFALLYARLAETGVGEIQRAVGGITRGRIYEIRSAPDFFVPLTEAGTIIHTMGI